MSDYDAESEAIAWLTSEGLDAGGAPCARGTTLVTLIRKHREAGRREGIEEAAAMVVRCHQMGETDLRCVFLFIRALLTPSEEAPAPLAADADPPERYDMQGRRMTRCQADDDGHCDWAGCPQLRDVEPKTSGRHCPLDRLTPSEERDDV